MALNIPIYLVTKIGGLIAGAVSNASASPRGFQTRVRVTVEGCDHVADTLRGLPNELGVKILGKATRDEAVRWQKIAIEKAPGPSEKPHKIRYHGEYAEVEPGNLKANIVVRRVRLQGSEKGYMSAYSVAINKRFAYYWTWWEFGAPNNDIPATAFMRGAFDEAAQQSLENVKVACQAAIDKYLKRRAREQRRVSRISKQGAAKTGSAEYFANLEESINADT